MYEAGARLFLEVGPKSTLTGMVGQTLVGRPHVAVALDSQSGSMRGLLGALGALVCSGVEVDLERLFQGRDVRPVDLSNLVASTRPQPAAGADRLWHVSGGGARAPKEKDIRTGALPAL